MLQANQDDGFFSASTGNYWGLCENTCIDLIFGGDCNPCDSGEVASSKGWHPDYNEYNELLVFCKIHFVMILLLDTTIIMFKLFVKTPTTECSGGGDPGDRKCEGNEIWECDNLEPGIMFQVVVFNVLLDPVQEEQCNSSCDRKM